jgi:hypothetical protein
MVLKKSKIKIPYIRLNFRIVRQSDVRWCGRSVDKIIIYLLPDCKKIGVCGNYDVDGYYEDNKSDYDNYDDAYDAFEDDEDSWDDY